MANWQAGGEGDLEAGRCALCGDPSPPAEAVWPGIVRCTVCGLMYTHPRPTPAAMPRYYESDYYSYRFHGVRPRSHRLKTALWRGLGMLPPGCPAGRPPFVARLLRALVTSRYGVSATWTLPAPAPEARFLDVGCGAGERLELARDLGWDTWGADLGEAAIREATQRAHRAVVASAEVLPFAENSFHYLNLSHVLEHLYDPLAALRECRRLLCPEGVVQVTVPNGAGWGARRYGADWRAWDLPRHLYHFTAATLTALVEKAGLHVAVVRTLTDEWVLQESRRAVGQEVSGSLRPTHASRTRARRGEGENLDVWCVRPTEREGDRHV